MNRTNIYGERQDLYLYLLYKEQVSQFNHSLF